MTITAILAAVAAVLTASLEGLNDAVIRLSR